MTARAFGFDVDQPLYPLLPFTKAEAVSVVVHRMHRRPWSDVEGMRFGFLLLGGITLFILLTLAAAFGLIALGVWMAHR